MKNFKIILFYGLAFLFVWIYVLVDLAKMFNLSEAGRLFLLCGSCVFLYFGGRFLSKKRKDNKPMKVNLWIYFILYLILLITLTLFDPMWNRGIQLPNLKEINLITYLQNSVNLIPFKTISQFINQFDSMYSSRQVLLNLFGNIIALTPMAFFLPLLFKKQNKPKLYILTIFLIIFVIEIVQLLTSSGRFDIDDFILNMVGSITMYYILRIKSVNSLIKNIFLLEYNKIDKKSIIKIIMGVLIAFLTAIGIVIFRNKLYDRNYKEYLDIHKGQYEFTFENKDCNLKKEFFYQDDLYTYYLNCYKRNDVYAIAPDGNKYLLVDLIDGKTKYILSMERVRSMFDYQKVEYTKDENFSLLKIEDKQDYDNLQIIINDENIISVKQNTMISEENKYNYNLYIVPKKEGNTNLNLKFTNSKTNKNIHEIYNIEVNSDLKLNFKKLN